jgi:DNA-binding beta-propeller fold protein YncE
VFVADADNNRIQRFDKTGSYELSFGQRQNPSYTLIHNELLTPVGICLDEDKNEIYVTDDNRRVLVFDTNGNFLRNWQDHILGGRGLAINPIDTDSIFVVNTSFSSVEVYNTKGYKNLGGTARKRL